MKTIQRPALALAAAFLAVGLASCQTQSSGNAGPVETWPSYRASQSRGGD